MGVKGDTSYAQTGLPDWVTMGNYSSMATECKFVDPHTHLCAVNRKCVYTTNWDQPAVTDKVIIGNDVWIGQGVTFIPGVTIGDGAIIGAYSVIAKDVPPYAVVVGNPQVIKRYRFTEEQINKLLNIKWWNWSPEVVSKAKEEMKDIDIFLTKYGN